MSEIRIRAIERDGIVEVKALMSHPMETGLRKDSNGNLVPAHFIKEVTCRLGERVVMKAEWGTAISKNPYVSFKFKGAAKGDTLTLSWVDNNGDSASQDAVIQ